MTTSRFDVNAERDYWNQRYATRELIWTAEANRFVAEEVSTLNSGRALDLAAGEGRNAVWLAERGWQVRAVDLSDVAIGKARQLATSRNVADRINFQTTDLRDYEPEAASFDLVMLIYLQLPQAELQPIICTGCECRGTGRHFPARRARRIQYRARLRRTTGPRGAPQRSAGHSPPGRALRYRTSRRGGTPRKDRLRSPGRTRLRRARYPS